MVLLNVQVTCLARQLAVLLGGGGGGEHRQRLRQTQVPRDRVGALEGGVLGEVVDHGEPGGVGEEGQGGGSYFSGNSSLSRRTRALAKVLASLVEEVCWLWCL